MDALAPRSLLVLVPGEGFGGAELHALILANGALQLGYDTDLATGVIWSPQSFPFCRPELKSVPRRLVKALKPVRLRSARFILNVLSLAFQLTRSPEALVLCALPWPTNGLALMSALRLLGRRAVFLFQLVPPDFHPSGFVKRMLQKSIQAGDGWIAISDYSKQLLARTTEVAAESITVIHNGVPSGTHSGEDRDYSSVSPNPIAKEELINICTVGRICHQKGYDLILPCLPHLYEEFPELRFHWVGEAEYPYIHSFDERLETYERLGVVARLGHRTDVIDTLERMNMFLLPTRYEGGQSLALTEAMSVGLPIVASDASGIPEVIRHGVEGLIFRNGDSCDLMEKLRWALRHPDEMKRMGAAARARQKEFTEEKMIAGTLACLEKVAGGEALV